MRLNSRQEYFYIGGTVLISLICAAFVVFMSGMGNVQSSEGVKCHCVGEPVNGICVEQIECDESIGEYGANKCLGDCDCSLGRECVYPKDHHSKTGVCVDKK